MVVTERGQVIERGYIVASLSGAIRDGDHGLKLVPGLLKRVCNEDCWRERYVEVLQEVVPFETFVAFVEHDPPKGLGIDVDILKKLCGDDVDAQACIEKELKELQPHGGDRRSGRFKDNNVNLEKPEGNSTDYALRRLRTDAPELHTRVIAGELSPHAAMIEAGFRRRTVTVPVDDRDKVAAFLAKHFDADEIATISARAIQLKDEGQ